MAILTNGKLAQRQRIVREEVAEMSTAVLVLPILSDKEEEWRRFAQDLLEDRFGEYEALERLLGVRGVKVYLARTSRREVILAYVEAEDPEEALRRLVASEEPFVEWFKEKLAELHGYDLGRPRTGPSPELIFEHPGGSGGP
jgi:hypothetical protein